MGGEAGVDSTPGVGSTFWFTVKLQKTKGPILRQTAKCADAERLLTERYRGHRILVVDDEPINLEVARMLLEDSGWVVDTAEDGEKAIALARERAYTAVFMDMQMPIIDGLEATRQIRRFSGLGQTPIIAMTANAFTEDKLRCLEAGMNDFLIKPFDPDTMFVTLLRVLNQVHS
jgi:CheY-like chemotaxis protein